MKDKLSLSSKGFLHLLFGLYIYLDRSNKDSLSDSNCNNNPPVCVAVAGLGALNTEYRDYASMAYFCILYSVLAVCLTLDPTSECKV